MSKAMEDDQKALVPRLRFPEFRGGRPWARDQLTKVCELNPANSELAASFVYIDLESVVGGRLTQKKTITRDSAPSRAQRVLHNGDVIFQVVRPYQKNNLFCIFDDENDYVASTGYAQLRAYNSEQFLYQAVHTDSFVSRVLARCTGSSYPAINSASLSQVNIDFPEPDEQQKIADCLAAIDERITATDARIDALKAHKKGLMQQLFPREGDTTPRLRFHQFRDAGEWEVRYLGDIAEIKLGKMLDRNKLKTGILRPYLNNLAVRWNNVDTQNLPKMYFDDHELDRYGLREGDVVVCEGGEPGRAAVWKGHGDDIKYQKAVHRVRFDIPFEPQLLVSYLESIAGTDQFEALFTGGGIKHLTRQVFSQLPIPVADYAEQQKIADCLSSLDELIAATTAQRDALREHKKGMMQQLFPSLDETAA